MSLAFQTLSTPQSNIAYLRSLPAIRERCSRVHQLAKEQKLEYFDYHPEREAEVVDYCVKIIQRDFGTNYDSIPPHSRWRHFDVGRPRIQPLINSWRELSSPPNDLEIAKRLIDLFLVSVLLDAGAGNYWKYTEKLTGDSFDRSEGLAVASFDMFVGGFFSDVEGDPFRVDAAALERITNQTVSTAMQVGPSNPMSGIDGRTALLYNLAQALRSGTEFFGDDARPGNLLDFLAANSRQGDGKTKVHISSLFTALIEGLAAIWPASRTSLDGVSLGDVWPCHVLSSSLSGVPADVKFNPAPDVLSKAHAGDDLVPFHKLTQWITYSLVEPIENILGWEVEGMEDMTGLPEYRNGGLLVDFGVLELRQSTVASHRSSDSPDSLPKLPPSHPAIIEWRAMTVIELDRIADGIRQKVGCNLKLAQVLESATWKGGREIAKSKRPATGGPPIEIESDGTVF